MQESGYLKSKIAGTNIGRPCNRGISLFLASHALADQSSVESGFRQADVGVRGVLVVQNVLSALLRGLRTVYIDLIRPLKGSGHQSDGTVHNAEHAADTGGFPALTVGNDRGSAHAQGGYKIDVTP